MILFWYDSMVWYDITMGWYDWYGMTMGWYDWYGMTMGWYGMTMVWVWYGITMALYDYGWYDHGTTEVPLNQRIHIPHRYPKMGD
jgi:hypothetical protein